jgi:hypothetical protein
VDAWVPGVRSLDSQGQPSVALGKYMHISSIAYMPHRGGVLKEGLEASGLVRMCRMVMRHMTSRMLRGTKGSERSKQESGTLVKFQVLKEITKLIKKNVLRPESSPSYRYFNTCPRCQTMQPLLPAFIIDASATCILSSFNT